MLLLQPMPYWVYRVVAIVIGIGLIAAGAVGALIGIVAILDPVGTKMADDNDPFGTPPSKLYPSILKLVFAIVASAGFASVVWAFLPRLWLPKKGSK